MIYKFNNTTHDIINSPYYDLYNYYKSGGKYKMDAPFHQYYCDFTSKPFTRITEELLIQGYKRVMGWIINFNDIWNRYLINVEYEGWFEVYAPSKMCIRDTFGSHKIIGEIIQL